MSHNLTLSTKRKVNKKYISFDLSQTPTDKTLEILKNKDIKQAYLDWLITSFNKSDPDDMEVFNDMKDSLENFIKTYEKSVGIEWGLN